MLKRVVMAVALCAAAGPSPALAQPPLQVPYLPQTEALCGGAAAAMVMRFWGARDVYADAFAPLVDWSAGGIRTSVLARALEERGWRLLAGAGDLPRLRAALTLGRPVIALIEDRPGRYHYVVVVSAADGGPVVHHDPARAPSRSLSASAFDARWSKADRWMAVVQPPPPSAPAPAPETPPASDARIDPRLTPACQSSMTDGLTSAERGDTRAARAAFEAAAAACPGAAAPWRELAGLAALARDWDGAARFARRATAADPGDQHAWRVLATAEYVRHRDLDALRAWNALGEPRVDLVEIQGLAHTRYMVVASAIGVEPRALLTPDALRLAQKRVRDLPAVSTARVTFHPVENGRAQVDATVVERARAPRTYPAWIGLGLGAVANSEAAAAFSNVSGGGDAVEIAWRWWEHRPRVGASYSAPGPGGVWTIDAFRETQTFASATRFEETRTSVGAGVGNWLTPRFRVAGGAAIDRWRGAGRAASASARVQLWPVLDRLRVEAGIRGWRGSPERFATADARAVWRSNAATSGTLWMAGGGYQFASASAPASLWPGADTGHARDVLLRAHPLLDDGVVNGRVFGRRIAFASAEVQRWVEPKGQRLLRIAPAVFIDLARAARGLPASDTRLHADAGAGLRIALLGFGVLRADVARGLRDGRTAFSVGWQR
ncbi:MAG TPA: C39 family peptidase [Vicinamibacterales bacterium]|nr:C39 family peptidase [Vicinamibacterales bacterium]